MVDIEGGLVHGVAVDIRAGRMVRICFERHVAVAREAERLAERAVAGGVDDVGVERVVAGDVIVDADVGEDRALLVRDAATAGRRGARRSRR